MFLYFILPLRVLPTCYPFRYSGHALGKVAFLLWQQDDDFNQENSDRYGR